ncbi:MAG: TetM/TetW/TetO/TetS family tetracycline resistance ribosomal protection protein [Clostridia bacterium]|nr:TetM/TetW/TetO/TetS family tetracycline resistance ribosomal protection protein [Clostridia bacterium]
MILGLLAHVDAGKTTLSEALLYTSGALRKMGRVDHKDAFLDTDIQERERGITIFSKQARMNWKETAFTLMDTPGHVDFSSEMERTLHVLDGAVLVISGTDGVQGHTETLWKLLESYQVPVFLFINKMDMEGVDRQKRMEEIREKLDANCVDMMSEEAGEQITLCGDDDTLNRYLETGEVPEETVRSLVSSRKLFPCYFGSALRMQGIDELLDGLEKYGPRPQYPSRFGAVVYKIGRDDKGARLTYMKITGGELNVRQALTNKKDGVPTVGEIWEEKVSQLRFYSGLRFEQRDVAQAGEICAVTGLNYTKVGDGFGYEKRGAEPILSPVFTYHMQLSPKDDPVIALQRMRQLQEEDPQLQVVWQEKSKEIHVQLMGEVQVEILQRMLKDRYDMDVSFGEGSILYKETIENKVEGVGHYEPLRHYAEVHLLMEPGPRGSGLVLTSRCPEDELDRNWQRLILTHLMEKTHLGVLTGAPVTDMRITLIAGRAHLKHTEGGDFRQATYRAVRQGLMQAKSVLLEPWYEMTLTLPEDCLGRAMHDIQLMGGTFDAPETSQGSVCLKAKVPVCESRHYAREVMAYAKGRGRVNCVLCGYLPCRDAEKVIKDAGYDPERDVENSPDSVFCSHGAGFMVKWDEVKKYQHIDTGILAKKKEDIQPIAAAPRPRAYSGSLEEDKELMAIFERTYGPIKQHAFRPSPRTAALMESEKVFMPLEKEYLLVDGYNIIFAWDALKEAAKLNLETARQMLVDILCNFRGVRPYEIIVVFDAYKVHRNPGSVEKADNIHVVYTKEAETADNYIEKATYDLGRRYRVRVATSDALEQVIILGHGALRVSAKEFLREVESANGEIRAYLAEYNRHMAHQNDMARAMQKAWQEKKQD